VTPSYIVPDSDDDAIAEENANFEYQNNYRRSKGKGRAESDLQTWIKHLTALLKEEEKKVGFSLCMVSVHALIVSRSIVQGEEEDHREE
jgi:hypothetical protein